MKTLKMFEGVPPPPEWLYWLSVCVIMLFLCIVGMALCFGVCIWFDNKRAQGEIGTNDDDKKKD